MSDDDSTPAEAPFLETVLADPETHEPLTRASAAQVEAINAALSRKKARTSGGGPLPDSVAGAYLSRDGAWVYPDVDGFPSFLIDERVVLDVPV